MSNTQVTTLQEMEYMKLAATKGAECGEYIASLSRKNAHLDAGTIHATAVGFVNRLPLNDIALEIALQREFEASAGIALRNAIYAEVR